MPEETIDHDEPNATADFSDLVGDDAQASPAEETAPEDIDWTRVGPKVWDALKKIMGGNKTRHDDKYVIEASHEDVAEAHDVLTQ